jgi:hypothetical protein
MTPSSMRLAELWLCLWWGCIRDQGLCRDTALGHLLVVPLGNISLGVWISMTSRDWRLSSHKGQWHVHNRSLPRGSIMTFGYYYGLPGTNVGEHSYGGSFGYLGCLPRVPTRCHKPLGSTLKQCKDPCGEVGMMDRLMPPPGVIHSCGSPWSQPHE